MAALPMKIAFWCFVTVAAFFLLTEHFAHVLGVLPYLLFLLCPLMHLFMHHGEDHEGVTRTNAPEGR